VVTTETVAKERVKIGTKTVEEAQQVSGEVRKEQIDMEPDTDTTSGRPESSPPKPGQRDTGQQRGK